MSQCGLCLSCGAPFFPSVNELATFSRAGNQSILYLNSECEVNRELRQKFLKPVYSSPKQGAHVFHESHHATAIDFMCNHHTADSDLAWPALRAAIPNQNGPFAFLKIPKGSGDKKPSLAVWDAPPAADRLAYTDLLHHITTVAGLPALVNRDNEWRNGLDERYNTCTSCNSVMTQQSNMAYTLGYTTTGRRNPHGCVITGQPIDVCPAVVHGASLQSAYGRWRAQHNAAHVDHPTMGDADSAAPHVAYYLHMCLPLIDAANPDPFIIAGAGQAARKLYIELSWLVLEIASLANLIEEGKRYSPGGKLSHGLQQHLGALDFYVSYFFWRLCYFEHMRVLGARGVDFIQWHQKYFWDAVNCSALLLRDTDLIGTQVYSSTSVNARLLLEDIARRLMSIYTNKLPPLVQFLTGNQATRAALPIEVRAYFLPTQGLRELKRRERTQVVKGDFESALQEFGASALLFRSIQLCPRELKIQLKDFREQRQWREIENARRRTPGLDMRTAYALYVLCSLLDPPDELPVGDKAQAEAILYDSEYCSPWTAVLALSSIGAFETVAQ